MVIKGYSELIDKVRDGKRKTVVLIEADDEHALEAVIQARDIVNAVLIGNVQKIEAVLRTIGQNPLDFNIVQVSPGSDPCQ
jgi:phosphotransacetylase